MLTTPLMEVVWLNQTNGLALRLRGDPGRGGHLGAALPERVEGLRVVPRVGRLLMLLRPRTAALRQ